MEINERISRHHSPAAYLWPLLIFLIVGGVLLWRFWPWEGSSDIDPNAAPRPVVARGDLAEDEKTTIAVFKQASPAVVHITTLAIRQDRVTFDLFQIPRAQARASRGTIRAILSPIITSSRVRMRPR